MLIERQYVECGLLSKTNVHQKKQNGWVKRIGFLMRVGYVKRNITMD